MIDVVDSQAATEIKKQIESEGSFPSIAQFKDAICDVCQDQDMCACGEQNKDHESLSGMDDLFSSTEVCQSLKGIDAQRFFFNLVIRTFATHYNQKFCGTMQSIDAEVLVNAYNDFERTGAIAKQDTEKIGKDHYGVFIKKLADVGKLWRGMEENKNSDLIFNIAVIASSIRECVAYGFVGEVENPPVAH